jgi:hypothetical protein
MNSTILAIGIAVGIADNSGGNPPGINYLLVQNGGFMLQQNNFKIEL